MATFASRLAQLRKEKNMSQHQLADALRMAHGSIGNYESGSRFPRYEDLEAIADFFNVELDYLCGRTNERPALSLEEQWIIQCYKNADADTVVGNHGLRRSLASLAYSKGIPERQIMQWCGWSDYQTMHKFYVKLSMMDAEKHKNAVTDFFTSETASEPENQIAN